MKSFLNILRFGFRFATGLLLAHLLAGRASAAGVTLITHGLNGNANGWVAGMANQLPAYPRFPGSNFTSYRMFFTNNGSGYLLMAERLAGQPTSSDSGEIIVRLDWSQLSDGNSYTTADVAATVAPALLNTNFFPGLENHALAEFPIHLIGHSRGGSLVCELSRLLGTNGIWVDHLTTLDPHPLKNPGFPFDFVFSAMDAPDHTYVNVLYHDNYWQNLDTFTYGEPVPGAFVRKLTTLSPGGYDLSHSDVHLWYHGSINLATPCSDTETNITSAERTSWWLATEQQGTNAGILHSLIGGGNRFSTNRPVGAGFPAIVDGYNQWWDLGAGVSSNRTAISNNNGAWPNLMRLNRTTTNPVVAGQSLPVRYYYQWAKPASSNATISFYLDNDSNPLNTNQTLLTQFTVPGTTATNIAVSNTSLTLPATNVTPGLHTVFAAITAAGRTRYLYAPEKIQVIPAPTLDISQLNPTQFRIGINGTIGQIVILQTSSNLATWQPLITNTLSTNRWLYTNTPPLGSPKLFYRTLLN